MREEELAQRKSQDRPKRRTRSGCGAGESQVTTKDLVYWQETVKGEGTASQRDIWVENP